MSETWNPLSEGHGGVGDELLVAIVDSSPVGALVVDDALRVVHSNAHALEMLGSDGNEHQLETLLTSSRLVRPAGLIEFLDHAIDEAPERSCHLIDADDGGLRCVEVSVRAVAGADDRVICWFRDITDSQQLRQFRLLAEIGRRNTGDKPSTDELASRLVDAILDALNIDIAVLAVTDRDGLRPIASRGMLLEDGFVLAPEFHPYVREAIESQKPVVSDGSEWESGELAEATGVHYVVPLLDGGTVIGTLHLGAVGSAVPFQTPEMAEHASRFTLDTLDARFLEALSAYAGSALANVRLFDEIRDGKAMLQTVVDSIPEGLLVFNGRGEVLIANGTSREIAELEWGNLNTDVPPYRICTPDGRTLPRGEWPFFRAVRTGEDILDEIVVLDFGDVEKHVQVSVVSVPVGDSKIAAYVTTLKDVTRRSEIQRRREEFVSVASHELRSPLTPLAGFLQMATKQVESGGPVDPTLLGRAQQQVGRLARLIDTLLDASRIETGRFEIDPERVELGETLQRHGDLWSTHSRDVEVDVVVPRERIPVRVDVDRFDEVLTNLIENAVKHSPDGTRVTLSARVDGDAAVVRVRDEGKGIAPALMPRVFDRFFSTSDGGRGRGLGLGLYISRQIVERHGGKLRIESEEGMFTEAIVELPLETH